MEAWVGPSDPGNMVVMIANSGALAGMTPHPSSCGSLCLSPRPRCPEMQDSVTFLFRVKVEECIVVTGSGTHRRRGLSAICTRLGS